MSGRTIFRGAAFAGILAGLKVAGLEVFSEVLAIDSPILGVPAPIIEMIVFFTVGFWVGYLLDLVTGAGLKVKRQFLSFLGLGIGLAFVLSYFITEPIENPLVRMIIGFSIGYWSRAILESALPSKS